MDRQGNDHTRKETPEKPVPSAESLTPEVLEQIFQRLEARHLKRVRLVCRRWRDIVTESPRLMNKFLLILYGYEFKEHFESNFAKRARRVQFRKMQHYDVGHHSKVGHHSYVDQFYNVGNKRSRTEMNDGSGIIAFCRKQTCIVELSALIVLTNQELCEIGRCLPLLKRVVCSIIPTGEVVSFLQFMPGLELLDISNYANHNTLITFMKFKNDKLKEAKFSYIHFAADNLQSMLEDSTNIRSITLTMCHCGALAELFSTLEQLKQLRCLEIYDLRVMKQENDCPRVGPLKTLKEFTIKHSSITSKSLAMLLQQCDQVQILKIVGINIEDNVARAICQNTQLRLFDTLGPITKAAAEQIRKHCAGLRCSFYLP